MRALLAAPPDAESQDQALAAFGLVRADDPVTADFEVWPEHERAVSVFVRMLTQWQVGLSGPVGLRYESLFVVLRLTGTPRAQWAGVFDDVRIMESEALKAFAERRSC